jgi:hypothetical protein
LPFTFKRSFGCIILSSRRRRHLPGASRDYRLYTNVQDAHAALHAFARFVNSGARQLV